MGSTLKPTIFNERVADALKKWHHTAKRQVKHSKHSEANSITPFSSRPATPTHGMSPVHLLHRHLAGRSDSVETSPRTSNYENEQWDVEGSNSPRNHPTGVDDIQLEVLEQRSEATELPITSTRHEISIAVSDFSFEKRHTGSD